MANVFMIAALPASDYTAAQSSWDSFPYEIRVALKDVEIRFKSGCSEYTTSPTLGGVAHKIFDGPIDEDDLSAIQAHWQSMRLICLLRIDGTWHTINRNGVRDYFDAVRKGVSSVGLSNTKYVHGASGWSAPDFSTMQSSSDMIVGVCLHSQNFTIGQRSTISTYGSTYGFPFRDDAWWNQIEESLGVYSMTNNVHMNAKFALYNAFGSSQNVAVLQNSNSLYGSGMPATADYRTAFVNYATYACAQLAPYVGIFEIYNEPDVTNSASDYAALLSAVYSALKSSYPNHLFVGPAISWPARSGNWQWLTEFSNSGGFSALDGVSIHQYFYNSTVPPSVSGWNSGQTQIDYVNNVVIPKINELSGAELPIYITEFGWSQADPTPSDVDTQAQYVTDFIEGAKTNAQIKGVWVYEMINEGADNSTNREDRFGLFYNSFTEKPAWTSFIEAI